MKSDKRNKTEKTSEEAMEKNVCGSSDMANSADVSKVSKAKNPLFWLWHSLLGLLLVGCSFTPEQNIEVDVYGPPEEYYEEPAVMETPGPTESQNEPEEDLELEFDVEMNEEICIYGPPEMFE